MSLLEKSLQIETLLDKVVQEGDMVILLLGRTGAGKSNFIEKFTNQELGISSSGLERGTAELQVYRILDHPIYENKIVMVDTPGFQDISLTEYHSLKAMREWILRRNVPRLHGLFSFDNIATRMSRSDPICFQLFQFLCGNEIHRACLVTTMWDELEKRSSGSQAEADQKYQSLLRYWEIPRQKEMQVFKFQNTPASADHILISHLQHNAYRAAFPLEDADVSLCEVPIETSLFEMLKARFQIALMQLNLGLGDTEAEIEKLRGELLEFKRGKETIDMLTSVQASLDDSDEHGDATESLEIRTQVNATERSAEDIGDTAQIITSNASRPIRKGITARFVTISLPSFSSWGGGRIRLKILHMLRFRIGRRHQETTIAAPSILASSARSSVDDLPPDTPKLEDNLSDLLSDLDRTVAVPVTLNDISAKDVLIAVMGANGVGKTSFIRAITGYIGPSTLHDLDAKTIEVQCFKIPIPNTKLHLVLIDTPGFDDPQRTNGDILTTIADWLKKSYSNGKKLNGIVYLHRITDVRFDSGAATTLRLFQHIWGDANLDRVCLATTNWNDVRPKGLHEYEEREAEFKKYQWAPLIGKGLITSRFDSSTEDSARKTALGTIQALITHSGSGKFVTKIQDELVDKKRKIHRTTAGKYAFTGGI